MRLRVEVTYKGPLSGLPDGVKLAVVASDGKLAVERVYEITYDQRPEFAGDARLYVDPDEVGAGMSVSISGVSAQDRDNEDISYRLAAAPKDLSIDKATGEITYKGPLSGLPDGVKLAVVASDGKLAVERVYEITYDQRPEFAGDARLYVDPDEVGAGMSVSISGVSAQDRDNEDISYRLAAAPKDLSIDKATGEITYKGPLSGLPDGVKLAVVASDGKLAVERVYEITYDQRPEFAGDARLYVDPDEVGAGMSVSISGVSAQDRDNEDISYRLAAAPKDLSIDKATGEITYKGPLSGLPDGVKLAVVASDGKLAVERVYEITYDQRPEFAGDARLYVDPDEVGAGMSVSISGVSAQDRDNEDISYRLAAAPKDLSIDKATGEITYKGPLSGLPDGVKLAVVASDGKLAVERVYEITYDQRPEFAGDARLYVDPDEVGAGMSVSISGVSAQDRDNEDISYRLAAAPKDLSIDKATGEITYKGPLSGLPDGVKLAVVASDGKLAVERVYEITYDQRPEFAGDARLYVDPDEVGAGMSVSISGVSAQDRDNEDISYRLAAAPKDLSIDKATGEITYKGPLSGLPDGVKLAVVASDGKLAVERVYEITYDQRPEFAGDARLYVDPDEVGAGMSVSISGVSAQDRDNEDISYRLVAAPKDLSIDKATGEITYKGPLSGLPDGVKLAVVASDGKLAVERVYEITYDQRPEFAGDARLYVDPDEVGAGMSVSISGVSAQDRDNEDISYRLAAAPKDLSIDKATGEITYKGPLSGLPDGVKLAVVASDGKLAVERVYEITYDQRPEFAGDARLYVDPDEVGAGMSVSISGVSAQDRDNEDISYRLAAAPKDLSIDKATGEITYKGPLSGLPDGVKLAVVASDGKLAVERVYEITYDQRPEFAGDARLYVDPDEVGAGMSVSISGVSAQDRDNEDISYRLAAAPKDLSIDKATGEITYKGPLSGLPDGVKLAVVASDGKLEAVERGDQRPEFAGRCETWTRMTGDTNQVPNEDITYRAVAGRH